MGFRKRISQILTPPTRRKSEFDSDPAQTPAPGIGGATRINEILKKLLLDEDRDSESTHANLSELREVAAKYGSYMTACEIQECVIELPMKDEAGNHYKKERGYELAADLHQQDLMTRLSAVSEGKSTDSLEDFGRFFKNPVGCHFLAEKHRKGIQLSLATTEDLILRGCSPNPNAPKFIALAELSAKTLMTLALQEKEKKERDYNKAKRNQRNFDTPIPEDMVAPNDIEDLLLSFLDDFRKKVTQVTAAIRQQGALPQVDFRELKGTEGKEIFTQHLVYTETIRNIAHAAQYYPLESFAYEQAGTVRELAAPGKGIEIFGLAAQLIERQADTEKTLGLKQLSNRHYEKASKLWYLVGDVPKANHASSQAHQ